MKRIVIGLAFILAFWACNSTSTENNSGKDSTNKTAITDSIQRQTHQPDIIEADEHSITDKIELKNTYLMGKEVSCLYTEIPSRLKEKIPGIMQTISEKKAVITGGYHIILKETPDASKPTNIFIGIPVQKAMSAAGLTTYTIAAGNYLRHQCSAEPGKSISIHQGILNMPFKKLKQKTSLPIIEKYNETRNDEMTSVISKATFYYTISQ